MAIQLDQRVNAFHLAVYAALLHLWYKGGLQSPLSITRREVMALAKIRANQTYHKFINDLQAFGYIQYVPSYHPALGSMVYFQTLQTQNGVAQ